MTKDGRMRVQTDIPKRILSPVSCAKVRNKQYLPVGNPGKPLPGVAHPAQILTLLSMPCCTLQALEAVPPRTTGKAGNGRNEKQMTTPGLLRRTEENSII